MPYVTPEHTRWNEYYGGCGFGSSNSFVGTSVRRVNRAAYGVVVV